MSASMPSASPVLASTNPHGGFAAWMPMTIVPLALTSAGVRADALVMAKAAAATTSNVRREIRVKLISPPVFRCMGFAAFRMKPASAGGSRQSAFEPRAVERQRPAHGEVEDSDDGVDEERPEVLVRDDVPRAGELRESHDRRERRAFDELHEEA